MLDRDRAPAVQTRRFTRPLSRAAARRRIGMVVVGIAVTSPTMAFADNWINPNGGLWSTGTNWSDGAPPIAGADYIAQFSLNAYPLQYIVSNPSASSIDVQNDQVEINFNGTTTYPNSAYGDLVSVTSGANQNSSLSCSTAPLQEAARMFLAALAG